MGQAFAIANSPQSEDT